MSVLMLLGAASLTVCVIVMLTVAWIGIGHWPRTDPAGTVIAEDWPKQVRRHWRPGQRIAVVEVAGVRAFGGVTPSELAASLRDEAARALRRGSTLDGVGWLPGGRLGAILLDSAQWGDREGVSTSIDLRIAGRTVTAALYVGTATIGADGRSVRTVVAAAQRRAVAARRTAEAPRPAVVPLPHSLGDGLYGSQARAVAG